MSDRHYCSKCGVSMTPNIGRTNIRWLIDNDIFDCSDCDPDAWIKADRYHMPLKAILKNKKIFNQWSKYNNG